MNMWTGSENSLQAWARGSRLKSKAKVVGHQKNEHGRIAPRNLPYAHGGGQVASPGCGKDDSIIDIASRTAVVRHGVLVLADSPRS